MNNFFSIYHMISEYITFGKHQGMFFPSTLNS